MKLTKLVSHTPTNCFTHALNLFHRAHAHFAVDCKVTHFNCPIELYTKCGLQSVVEGVVYKVVMEGEGWGVSPPKMCYPCGIHWIELSVGFRVQFTNHSVLPVCCVRPLYRTFQTLTCMCTYIPVHIKGFVLKGKSGID